MVERKIRPAPLNLVARKSARSAGKPGPANGLASPSKLFVLDTNVLMHDPTSLFRFEEHDIYLPILTLEELDNNKKGVTEVARNARQASRFLDELVTAMPDGIVDGVLLAAKSGGAATGKLFLQTEVITTVLPASLAHGKADNQILAVVMHLQHLHPKRHVILVSKDINMRIKARALGIAAEDYYNDKVLEDTDLLYSGTRELPADFWERHGKAMESWQQSGHTYYRITGPLVQSLLVNEFVYQEKPGEAPLYALVKEISGRTAVLQTLKDYTHQRNNVWGIAARNREQNFALNLLMNPDVDFVSLLGQAGTGKTLLTLAAGLMLTLEFKVYSEIIMTRVTVPVGEDIGFLPGTEEEKMNPWMGALEDNLDVLNKTDDEAGEWGRAATRGQEPQLHARAHVHQQVPHHRRGAEPDAQADEDHGHARGAGDQGRLPRQHRADRYPVPYRGEFRHHLRRRPVQGLGALGPRDAAARRAIAARRPRRRDPLGLFHPAPAPSRAASHRATSSVSARSRGKSCAARTSARVRTRRCTLSQTPSPPARRAACLTRKRRSYSSQAASTLASEKCTSGMSTATAIRSPARWHR
jgi:PhoH-like ATPase